MTEAPWPGPMPDGFEPLYQYMCDRGYTIDPNNLVRQAVACVLRDLELAKAYAYRDGCRDGHRSALDDVASGAFISGSVYDAIRNSFSGRKMMAEAWDEGYRARMFGRLNTINPYRSGT